MFNYHLFSHKMSYISEYKSCKVATQSIFTRLVNEGKVEEMHIDILGTDNRQELIDTAKIHYHKHTSWKYIENKNPHDHTELKNIIDSCLSNDVANPVLNRNDNGFW